MKESKWKGLSIILDKIDNIHLKAKSDNPNAFICVNRSSGIGQILVKISEMKFISNYKKLK